MSKQKVKDENKEELNTDINEEQEINNTVKVIKINNFIYHLTVLPISRRWTVYGDYILFNW